MKAFLFTLLVCLCVHFAAPHTPFRRRGLPGLRPRRHPGIPGPVIRPPSILHLQKLRPIVHPIKLRGQYNGFKRNLIHMLKKKNHYLKKKMMYNKPSFRPMKTPRVPSPRVVLGGMRRHSTRLSLGGMRGPSARLPLGGMRRPSTRLPKRFPVPFRHGLGAQMMPRLPRIPTQRRRMRFHNPSRLNVRGPRIMPRNPFPFHEVDDDFRGFNDGDFDEGRFDRERFADFNDIDDTFDSRFEEGFGSVGGFPRGMGSQPFRGDDSFRDFGDDFDFDFDSSDDIRRGALDGGHFDTGFNRNTHGPTGAGASLQDIDRRPDFDDHDFKPLIPDLVDDAMENIKEAKKDIHEDLKHDDGLLKGSPHDHEDKDSPIPDDIRDDRVPDLVDIVHSASNNVIDGFEMLGSRQSRHRGGSDLTNIFRNRPFDIADDPFSRDFDDDHMDKFDDNDGLGTFALLGIDPGSAVSSIPRGQTESEVGTAMSGATRGSQVKGDEGSLMDWPLDFGFTNDKNMNIVLNDVPPPSTL